MTQSEQSKLLKALYGMMGRKADEDVLAGWSLALHGQAVEAADLREWCQQVGAEGWRGWAPEPSEFLSWLRQRRSFGVHPDKVLTEPLPAKLAKARVRKGLEPNQRDPQFMASLPHRIRDAYERADRGEPSIPNPFNGGELGFEFDPFASE